jgi:ketosteroid isomerase-like protein
MFEPGDPKVDITALVAGESLVAVEARGRGCLAGGPEYRSTYAFFVEVERGKVRALREYMDSLAVSRLLSA